MCIYLLYNFLNQKIKADFGIKVKRNEEKKYEKTNYTQGETVGKRIITIKKKTLWNGNPQIKSKMYTE